MTLQDIGRGTPRRNIAFVSQSPLRFSGSLFSNLRYPRAEATVDEVLAACRAAYASDFITTMPDAYESLVGAGGARLSSGQRQRLVLARSFLSEAQAPILDEPTTSLDRESERSIERAVHEIVEERGMTVVAIANCLSTIRPVGQSIVLRNGEVLEQGTPD